MSITELSIKRPTLIVVIFTVLAILGIGSYTQLNYDLIPKLNFPTLSVATVYPGASANEVESTVTKKLEDALSSLEDVKHIQSTSQEGLSMITITLDASTDADKMVQNAQRKINTIAGTLPVGVRAPSVNKFSSDELPVLKLSVTGTIPPTELYQLTSNQLTQQLAKLKGVGQISIVGGNEREIRININKSKLDAYKISISQIYQAVMASNVELPTGKIESNTQQYTVRLLGKVKSLEEMRNITVAKTMSGSYVKLSDVAEVVDDIAEQSSLNRINGQNAIGLIISKQSDANTVDVCKKVKAEIKNIEQQYASSGVKFFVGSDNSDYTVASTNAVMEDLMLAILIVSLVMFVFLHSIRNSLIVLVSIPASIISVFIGMYIFNFSLNLLTLMALSLVIGILVDDSIVVLENITRHLEMGKEKRIAALVGRSEIGFTAVAITLVDVVVFLPLSLVSGMIGNMLREFSLVVVFSTLMSLFVSFTVTPLLASRFGKVQKNTKETIIGRFSITVENIYNSIRSAYESLLRWGLNHRRWVYAMTLAILIGAFALPGMGLIGMSFMNDGDQGEFIVKIEGDPQNTLYQTTQLTQQVEAILMKQPEVVKVYSNVGYAGSAAGASMNASNKAEITVDLVPKDQRSIGVAEYAAKVKTMIQEIPGIKVTSTPISMMGGGATDAAIQVLLRGPDVDGLFRVGDSVKAVMRQIPGINDVTFSIDKSNPEMQIKINREKMEQLGLNVQQVGSTLNFAYAGNTNLKFSEGDQDYDINVMLDQFDRKNINDLGTITFLNNQGKPVQLSNFATITQSLGPNKLERYDRISSLYVKASVFGRPAGTVGSEVKQAIAQKIKPGNVEITMKGQMESMMDAFKSLLTALLAAIIFVYLVMVALYNSYRYPFVVLFSIPVAVVGAFLALALSGEAMSIYAMIGMIMLIGLVAKNAILLVDFTNKFRAEGHSVFDSLVEAGKERLRPILMTTLAMVFGMMPIALATGAGAESKNGMAWVIIGGLISSLLLTLVLVPAVYMTFEKYATKFSRKKKKELPVE